VVAGWLAPRRAAAAGLGRTRRTAATPVGTRAASHGILLPCCFTPILAAIASGDVLRTQGAPRRAPGEPGLCTTVEGALQTPDLRFYAHGRRVGTVLECACRRPRRT